MIQLQRSTPVRTGAVGVVGRGARMRWRVFLVIGTVLAIVHAAGVVGDLAMVALSVAAPLAIGCSIRSYRPEPHWPWVLVNAAGVLWSAAGAIRAAVGATGDLSADRSLVPDVFAVAGYTMFAVALLRMLKSQGTATRSKALVLDGGIMALSALVIGWVSLVAPVLFRLDAAPIAKFSIVIYPPISALLVWVAARLAFGTAERGRAQSLLLLGMLALLVGDVAYVPLETRLLDDVFGRFLELPYAMAYTLIGAAALHPSMRDTVRPRASVPRATGGRFALISVALLTPALALLLWSPASLAERVVVGVLAMTLGFAAIARVIVAARAQEVVEERLAYRASYDDLTGLLNRAGVNELIDQHLDIAHTTGEPLAVLFIDLDRFKLVNDSYGHAAGDQLLLAAADRLRTSVGEHDTVARLSGDEFLVVSPSSGVAEASALAERVCGIFFEPFQLIGTAWVTASVGVVVTDGALDQRDAATMLRDADTAMYQAKAVGRGSYAIFNSSMRAKSTRLMEIYNGLHLAIERNEFEVDYQVMIDAPSGTVHGIEALVRWRSPDGRIPPDQFISVAEDSGLIAGIGEFVLRESCSQVARWRRLPGCADLALSVNVSAIQIVDVDIVALVSDVLDESGLEPDALWLEITESVMMTDSLDTLAAMSGLRSLGVHLSVDDFGTGYSSLTYLQRYPIEQVKIDRQFVSGMCDRSEDHAVVTAVVGIAQALNLSIVAEGVEEQAQVDRLDELGCTLLQGFLYARPVPAIDLGPILIERNETRFPPSRDNSRRS